MLYIYVSLCLAYKQNKHATVVNRAALGMFNMLQAVCFELHAWSDGVKGWNKRDLEEHLLTESQILNQGLLRLIWSA